MGNDTKYTDQAISLDEVKQTRGWMILEFGENWCSICQAANPIIEEVLDSYPDIKRNMVLDGRGKKLGRQFKVKLWPSLLLFKDGELLSTLVRPDSKETLLQWLGKNKQ